VFVQPIFEAD